MKLELPSYCRETIQTPLKSKLNKWAEPIFNVILMTFFREDFTATIKTKKAHEMDWLQAPRVIKSIALGGEWGKTVPITLHSRNVDVINSNME